MVVFAGEGGERVAFIILFIFIFIKMQLGTKTINLNLKFCRLKNKNFASGDVWCAHVFELQGSTIKFHRSWCYPEFLALEIHWSSNTSKAVSSSTLVFQEWHPISGTQAEIVLAWRNCNLSVVRGRPGLYLWKWRFLSIEYPEPWLMQDLWILLKTLPC